MVEDRILISALDGYVDRDVTLAGWVAAVRNQKRMQFVILRDHTGLVQLTNEKKDDDLERRITSLVPESVIIAEGRVVHDDHIRLGQKEVRLYDLRIETVPEGALPLDANSPLDTRLDWRFLDLRSPKNTLLCKVQTTVEHAMRSYWLEHGFVEIHSPKLTAGATESGAELFQLDYFGQKASLAQSPQFYKQMAMAAGLDRVFEIGPVFRANPSHTTRHDTEFTSVDVEMSWIGSPEEVMRFEEHWLWYVLGVVAERHGTEFQEKFGVTVRVPELPFPRVQMQEAYAILKDAGYTLPREQKGDLDPEGERLLHRHVAAKTGHEFVFVTDYPVSVRPFYHMRYADRPDVTKSFDLLWKGLEVTTGAQREHRYGVLVQQAVEKGVDPGAIKHYLDFFKYGCPPHGGYGFGLTRMLMTLVNAPNVREVTYVYRGPTRLTP